MVQKRGLSLMPEISTIHWADVIHGHKSAGVDLVNQRADRPNVFARYGTIDHGQRALFTQGRKLGGGMAGFT